jgi:hypothetical protein
MHRRAFLQAALTLTGAGITPRAAAQAAAKAARVLFIGNSLTYANDLPSMVEALVTESGGAMTSRTIAFPDFGLAEHWQDGRAMGALREGKWTMAVLQQGPSSLPESQAMLRDYTKRFAREARQRGAEVALFSVWPPRSRAAAFDAVTESYKRAAHDVAGMLVPAGEAMRAALRRDPSLPLFEADGFHPSPMGSYLVALVFVQRFTGRSPATLPPPAQSTSKALRALRTTPAQLKSLQDAVVEVTAGPPAVALA